MNVTTNKKEIKNPSWNKVLSELGKIDGHTYGYLILEHDNGDYLQCAGNPEMLTIEYRIHTSSKFKHYVIGKGEDISPLNVSWVTLQTTVGAIMIHKKEVLNLNDAQMIFKAFYDTQTIPSQFTKRNVTKLHLE